MASHRRSCSRPPPPRRPAPAASSASSSSSHSRLSYRDAAEGAALCSGTVSDVEPLEEGDGERTVRGVLHQPRLPRGDGIVLAHGAGSNRDSPVLRAVATAFAARGVAALRIDLPFRQARGKGPPSPAVFVHGTRDPFGLLDEMEEARGLMPGPTRLVTVRDAGHDLGARTATAFAASAVDELLALLG